MDKSKLRSILEKHLEKYKLFSYTELEAKVNDGQPEVVTFGTLGEGDFYVIEIDFVFDNCKSGDIRVLGMADNCAGIKANDDFIISPSGKIM